MRTSEVFGWNGWVCVFVRDRSGHIVEEWQGHNLITDAGKNLLLDVLAGVVTDGYIRYVALGDSTAAPANSDTKLGNERFRKQVTKRYNGANVGQLITDAYISPYEANEDQFTIQEIGWFAGPDAADTKDSGILIARILYSRAKTDLESLQIQRTDSIG